MTHFIGTGENVEAEALLNIHEVSMIGDDVQVVAARLMKVVMPAVIQSVEAELNDHYSSIQKDPINFVMGAILASANVANNYLINFCPEDFLEDEIDVVVDAMAKQFRICLEHYIRVAKEENML